MKYAPLLILLFFFSCRASRENRTITRQSHDSTVTIVAEKQTVSKDNSIETKQNDIKEESAFEAELEFETEDSTYSVKHEKVNGASSGWLDVALNNPRLKKIKLKGNINKLDNSLITTINNKSDSTTEKEANTTAISEKKEVVTEVIKTEQWSVWRLLPWHVWLVLSIVVVGVLWWKFPILFKRKKTEKNGKE